MWGYLHKPLHFVPADDQILVQLGAYEGERQAEFMDGLKALLIHFRQRKVRDFQTISQGILDYRARFRGDPSKILPISNVNLSEN